MDQRAAPPAQDAQLVDELLAGDQAAFARLVDMLSPALLRMARMYVATEAEAEEVVQDTWLAVVRGLDRFERRSSLKTWIFRILMNIARTRGKREARSIPFSSAFDAGSAPDEPAVDPERFLPPDHRYAFGWSMAPSPWPEDEVLTGEALDAVKRAIEELPPAQREVITLRDVVGCSAEEACNALEVSETNQRVLLHRARAKVRAAVERELGAMEPNSV
ncbi:MAG: RNA polymerase sigma factor [Thermoleophilaceae bacterium]